MIEGSSNVFFTLWGAVATIMWVNSSSELFNLNCLFGVLVIRAGSPRLTVPLCVRIYRSASDGNKDVKSVVGKIRSLLFRDPRSASEITFRNTKAQPRVQSVLSADRQTGFHNSSINVFDCRKRESK